ncbi:Transcriptional regulatory protein LiaR [bacterium HR18]|nr:Transcriptional regulatory protein LiaR [bacterium HR18]
MIRVALVDDEVIVHETVAWLLQKTKAIELIGSYASAAEGLQSLRQKPPHVALIDIGLPDRSGLSLIETLRPELPKTEFLVLTVFDDDLHILEAIMAGATGYLLKSDVPAQLVSAIYTIHEGGSWMSASIARKVLTLFKQRILPPQNLPNLSPREREILQLLTQGFSSGEIGRHLHISIETVRSHIRNIYQKLQVHNRAEIIARLFMSSQNHPNG